MDDQHEESSSQVALDLETPEDNTYEPTSEEEETFVADVLGHREAAPEVETPAKYGSAPARDGWPIHTYETKGGKGIKIFPSLLSVLDASRRATSPTRPCRS